jgi:hypothetical protein
MRSGWRRTMTALPTSAQSFHITKMKISTARSHERSSSNLRHCSESISPTGIGYWRRSVWGITRHRVLDQNLSQPGTDLSFGRFDGRRRNIPPPPRNPPKAPDSQQGPACARLAGGRAVRHRRRSRTPRTSQPSSSVPTEAGGCRSTVRRSMALLVQQPGLQPWSARKQRRPDRRRPQHVSAEGQLLVPTLNDARRSVARSIAPQRRYPPRVSGAGLPAREFG